MILLVFLKINDFIKILEVISNELSNRNPNFFKVLESINNIGVKFRNNRVIAMCIKEILEKS